MLNIHTFPALKLLADGKFHSGEAIARQLQVSRATVWNALKEAESLGVEIYSVRGRGYKLPQALSLLNVAAITDAMGDAATSIQLEVHDHLESTNSYLMQKLATGLSHATCVATNLQSKGRGRRGRSWHAGLGGSLTFSLLWRFQCGAAALSGLSLAVGVALIRALHSLGLSQAQLKWPNDVLINREKLAGILIELQGDMEGPSSAVIGIGINLNLPASLKLQIDQPATDIASASTQPIDNNVLLGRVILHLHQVLRDFEQHGFKHLKNEWTQQHAYHQQQVRMLMPNGSEILGVVQGIAVDGSLQIETAQGLQTFSSGEVSLRGT